MAVELEKWRKAGEIARRTLDYGVSLVKKGVKIREACDKIDQKVVELGGIPAWPVQVSMDHVAAHYTPDYDDDEVFEEQVVKLDVGACYDGYIGDNAATIDLSGKYSKHLKAAEEALYAAEKILKAGVTLNEIGKEIENTMRKYELRPIKNLSGHALSRWVIHDKPSIPNIANGSGIKLEEGQVIAIEPFATNGIGFVDEYEKANIFSVVNKKPVRSPYTREVLKFILEEYNQLPFCHRWLAEKFGPGKASLAIRELMKAAVIHEYPPLVERTKGIVAQFENTYLITKEGYEKLTKFEG